PAKSIQRRDIAITGAIGTANIGYVYEVSAHWISSYFLGENMRLPGGPEEAIRSTVRNLAWMKTRYPRWIQAMDDLLDDMYLPSRRSGGNWLTWVFRPVRSEELLSLSQERKRREESRIHRPDRSLSRPRTERFKMLYNTSE
ncbi:hypothetical protein FA13DRAFT_1650609, partial [Coprinellus micaceus]